MDYQRLYEKLPKEPIKWTVGDIEIWLRFIGLSNLYPKFSKTSPQFRITIHRRKLHNHPNLIRPQG